MSIFCLFFCWLLFSWFLIFIYIIFLGFFYCIRADKATSLTQRHLGGSEVKQQQLEAILDRQMMHITYTKNMIWNENEPPASCPPSNCCYKWLHYMQAAIYRSHTVVACDSRVLYTHRCAHYNGKINWFFSFASIGLHTVIPLNVFIFMICLFIFMPVMNRSTSVGAVITFSVLFCVLLTMHKWDFWLSNSSISSHIFYLCSCLLVLIFQ